VIEGHREPLVKSADVRDRYIRASAELCYIKARGKKLREARGHNKVECEQVLRHTHQRKQRPRHTYHGITNLPSTTLWAEISITGDLYLPLHLTVHAVQGEGGNESGSPIKRSELNGACAFGDDRRDGIFHDRGRTPRAAEPSDLLINACTSACTSSLLSLC
jgi:hypothetical protein